jgi:hypothetical protein
MAINRFAILTDGFAKPGTIVGSDWASSTGRALLITWGYLNRAFSGVIAVAEIFFIPWHPNIPKMPHIGH